MSATRSLIIAPMSRWYLQPSYQVVGYTADADMWCPDCAARQYGNLTDDTADREGNTLGAVFSDQVHDTCLSWEKPEPASQDDWERRHPQECTDRCNRCGSIL